MPTTNLLNGITTAAIVTLAAATVTAPATAQPSFTNTPVVAAKSAKPVYKGINVDTRADRKKSRLLHKTTLKAGTKTYVFVPNKKNIKKVTFFLNNKKIRTEVHPPFDMHGGSVKKAWGTTFPAGKHTAKAIVTFTNGKTQTRLATFTVKGKSNTPGKPGQKVVYRGINVDTNPDRSTSRILHKATLNGGQKVAVFVPAKKNIKKVAFSLNGKHVRTESHAPFDMHGGSVKEAWGSVFPAGKHSVQALVTFTNGKTQLRQADFTVNKTPAVKPGKKPMFMASQSPDRSNPYPLDGELFTNNEWQTCAFILNTGNIAKVDFHHDGNLYRTDTKAPFDVNGSDSFGNSHPLSGVMHYNGRNKIKAQVHFTDGTSTWVSAQIRRDAADPHPDFGPRPRYFRSPWISGSDALDGSTIKTGTLPTIYLPDNPGYRKVTFTLNGKHIHTDHRSTFTLHKGNLFKAKDLKPGKYTLKAKGYYLNPKKHGAKSKTWTAKFTVKK